MGGRLWLLPVWSSWLSWMHQLCSFHQHAVQKAAGKQEGNADAGAPSVSKVIFLDPVIGQEDASGPERSFPRHSHCWHRNALRCFIINHKHSESPTPAKIKSILIAFSILPTISIPILSVFVKKKQSSEIHRRILKESSGTRKS